MGGLNKYLVPKSVDEVRDALLNVKIGAFKLSSYLQMDNAKDPDFIKYICEQNNLNPAKMEISMLKDPIAQFVDEIFIRKGYKEDIVVYTYVDHKHFYGKEYDVFKAKYVDQYKEYDYEFSKEYKIIRCTHTGYYIYPSGKLIDILIDII